MPDIQAAVVQVAVRNTSSGKTVYDVSCADGVTRQVWEANLANAINAFAGTGQPLAFREQVSQNGQYTNRTIKAFAPPGQALPPEQAGGGSPGGFRRGGGMTPEDKTRISKMSAQGTAAIAVGSLFQGAGPEAYDQLVELLDKLTLKLYKSARSHEKDDAPQVLQTGAQGQILPVAGTPAEVAALVPGVTVGVPAVAVAQDASAEAAQPAPVDDIDWN